jgi:hypothetical protein
MDAARSVTATFTALHALTVDKAGTGSGSVASSPAGVSCGSDCTETYVHGTSVTLTATAATGSTFTSWSGACTGSGACVVTMDAGWSVTATFTRNQYTLTVTRAGTGSGTVTSSVAGIDCGSDCSETYAHGTDVTLTPVAAAKSVFSGWSGACTGSGACVVTMDAARSVSAVFSIGQGNDFNGDGATDLLWHHQTSGELYAWLLGPGTGDRTALSPGAALSPNTVVMSGSYLDPGSLSDTNWQVRGLADWNSDGRVDVLWHNQATGDLYVWFMDGLVATGGSYLTPRNLPSGQWQIRGVADFDADGRADILWHHQTIGDLYVWLMDGVVARGGSYLTPKSLANTRWQIRALADFDGDGKVDILWHHQATGELYAWFLDGTATTGGSYLTPDRFADTAWRIVMAADFSGDGRPDLLWHNQATGHLYVWYLDAMAVAGGSFLTPDRFADTNWRIVPR